MLNANVPALNIPYHIIENGENLFSISVRYNVKLQKILLWNGLKESDRVQNGTRIYLNDPNIYHDINDGDTLFSIATQHSVLIDQLMRWNKLSPDVALEPGHRLLLVDPDSYAL
jgi:LysM repeat protein